MKNQQSVPNLQNNPYRISHDANVLGDIYSESVSLSCFCCPESWALSNAARAFSSKHHGDIIRFQGPIDSALFEQIENLFKTQTHGDLVKNHIVLMLNMFHSLFEPNEVGFRVQSCDYAKSPAFHVNKMIARMTSTLGGQGEQWLTKADAYFHPLKKHQLAHQITPKSNNVINYFCGGDIALFKGTNWQDHESLALITASPLFESKEPRLCIDIDYIC